MKPGVSFARTAVWPKRRVSAINASPIARSVARPSMTSATFINGTGLKKCQPTTRCGRRHAAAIAVIDSDDVFDASTASGADDVLELRGRPAA